MSASDDQLQAVRGGGPFSRRQLLLALPALAAARQLLAQTGGAPIRIRALNHMTLTVSDPKRSLAFYQGLFGMPIQARQGATTILRIGSGPQFLALSGGGATATPRIDHYCVTVENFDVDRLLAVLGGHGVTPAAAGAAPGGGLSGGAMKVRVRMRGENAGGAAEGTPEIYVGDPDGIVVQLQDPRYCGGAGRLGEVCTKVEPAPGKGLLTLRDLSHFTIAVSDPARTNAFYQKLFGLTIQAHQGAAPLLGVGSGDQFVMFTGGGGANAKPRRPEIDHVCLTVDDFDVDRILGVLAGYGITPRGDAPGPPAPLKSYVSMRMPNRGGAPGGTPELYFTDPDGLRVQLQDPKYCGGGGYLGDECA